jgi:hypothetical protein
MRRDPGYGKDAEAELAEFIASFYDDPYGFVMAAYPWGEKFLADGVTLNPLRNKKGPEAWQRDILVAIGQHIKDNAFRAANMMDLEVWRSAVASGHGVGKSALVAWLIHFFMATRADTRGVVTANTANQLETKTWPELAKWHGLFICKSWFKWTATSYSFAKYDEDKVKNYMVNAATVSEHNTEAFQGLHNEGRTVFVIFDEASGIFPKLWEVVDGAFTDGEAFFLAFGNPTQPDGAFADCFGKHAHMYWTKHVNSMSVSHTNKSALNDILRKYGKDSDEAKVRVYGQFPEQSFNGFISPEAVDFAVRRDLTYDPSAALIMAVDVARFGPDSTFIRWRQGRDARTRPPIVIRGRVDTEAVADRVAKLADIHKPDGIVIESVGPGAGVIDKLKRRGYPVYEVHPGAPSRKPKHYANLRSELWAVCRDWIIDEGCLPEDAELREQLTTIRYTLDKEEQRYKLESKEDMRDRTNLPSPDNADSLVLTFGVRIAHRDPNRARRNTPYAEQNANRGDYDPLSY